MKLKKSLAVILFVSLVVGLNANVQVSSKFSKFVNDHKKELTIAGTAVGGAGVVAASIFGGYKWGESASKTGKKLRRYIKKGSSIVARIQSSVEKFAENTEALNKVNEDITNLENELEKLNAQEKPSKRKINKLKKKLYSAKEERGTLVKLVYGGEKGTVDGRLDNFYKFYQGKISKNILEDFLNEEVANVISSIKPAVKKEPVVFTGKAAKSRIDELNAQIESGELGYFARRKARNEIKKLEKQIASEEN